MIQKSAVNVQLSMTLDQDSQSVSTGNVIDEAGLLVLMVA